MSPRRPPWSRRRCPTPWVVAATLGIAATVALVRADDRPQVAAGGVADGDAPVDANDYPVPPPPFTDGIFPCSQCHADLKPNPQRRELTDEHTGITLRHGPRERWCFDCHDPDDRDQLHLASGAPVPFSQSYRLCGQCHGDKFRDWKVGIHGKRTGMWNGKKSYLLCAHCHNPHAPRFAPLKPEPPPVRPRPAP